MSLESDAVSSRQQKSETVNHAFLLLGSNIEPESNIPRAVTLLGEQGQILRCSQIWESAPVGDPDQPNFLNLAILFATGFDIPTLKIKVINAIEKKLNRVRDPENINAARTIDIDISLFNDLVINSAECRIPDPDILNCAHIAIPLAELAPDYAHPIDGRTLKQIANSLRYATSMHLRDDVLLKW